MKKLILKLNIFEETKFFWTLVIFTIALTFSYLYFFVNSISVAYKIDSLKENFDKVVLEKSNLKISLFQTKENAMEEMLRSGTFEKNSKIKYVKRNEVFAFNR